MTRPTGVRTELLEPLRRVLRWMASLRDADGRIVCPDHKVEHTGKNVGAAVMACEMLARDPRRDEAWLVDLALLAGAARVRQPAARGDEPVLHVPPGPARSLQLLERRDRRRRGQRRAGARRARAGPRLEASERERSAKPAACTPARTCATPCSTRACRRSAPGV
jgi:hypothetical protein